MTATALEIAVVSAMVGAATTAALPVLWQLCRDLGGRIWRRCRRRPAEPENAAPILIVASGKRITCDPEPPYTDW